MAAASSMNYKTAVCYGFDDGKKAIEEYLKWKKARKESLII
jgi:hypothetical protein